MNLVEDYWFGHATPDHAKSQLKQFRGDFEAAINDGKWAVSRHGDLVFEKPATSKQIA